jgi:hypothetical protein
VKISQPEGGGNGESREVVNQWLRWRAPPAGFADGVSPICCAKASVGGDFRGVRGILLTVRGGASFSHPGAQRIFAMIETVTAVLGLFSAGIFLAHAFEGFRTRA